MQDESLSGGETPSTEDNHPSIITVGPIRLDTLHHLVTVDDKSSRLTPVENKVLQYLAVHTNTIGTPNQIGSSIRGGPGVSNLIKMYIHSLRKKIEPDPMHPIYLLTIPEGGYMLVSGDQNEAKHKTSMDAEV